MINALYIGQNPDVIENLSNGTDSLVVLANTILVAQEKDKLSEVNLVVADKTLKGSHALSLLTFLKTHGISESAPVILVADSFSREEQIQFIKAGFAELCLANENIMNVVRMVLSFRKQINTTKTPKIKKIGFVKRTFDIVFASTFLLFASPILAAIAIAIRLDSKGPIVYRSKRVGHGYQVFDFLKFRTMKMNADHLVKEMMKENQYKNEAEALPSSNKSTEFLIDAMGNTIDEETFIASRKQEKAGAFFKVKDDPRITKIGRFLRATSLDELPQFINVLKGDMSIIGNRPLPLYEAEQLTTDHWAARFLAPAGITGLWQVEKRGKAAMSETERKELDNYYTLHQSFLYDMRILAKTIPALLQKENV